MNADIYIIQNIFDVPQLLASRQWQPLVDGVRISMIYNTADQGPRAAFLHYLPGAKVPTHEHRAFEHILILQGYQMDGEKCYSVGTLVIHPVNSQHALESPEGCVALGIWEKPVAFIE
jgi:anti-sigma factor ChrR (cupin superfamily)